MKDYDAYLFDWDGTVAQSLAVWLAIISDILKSYGADVDDKQIVRQVFGRPRGFVELGVPEEDLKTVFRGLDKRARIELPRAPLYPAMRDLLERLQQKGKQTGLITATVRSVITKTVDTHGLHNAFTVIVTGDEVKEHKPDPEGILYVLKQLGVSKGRAVMMGDSEKDILAAHNAGIDSLLFYPPEHEPFHNLRQLQTDKPTYTIHSWQELVDQLQ
jgi:HAD superfamily hydrolase (TIGR01549 family)